MPISATLKRAIKKNESRTVMGPDTQPSDRPDYEAPIYTDQIDDVGLVRDVYGGTKRMREKKKDYLPQYEAEEDADYKERLKTSVLFNATKRTVGGLVGMPFRKGIVLGDDVPEVIGQHAENIDLQGRHLDIFARDAFTAAILDGHTFIHVDFPTVDPEAVRTEAEERRAGVRPYWIHVPKSDVINIRWHFENGEPVIDLFVYVETVVEPDGEFGQVEVERFRVLRPGSFEVWQKATDDNGRVRFTLVEDGPVSLGRVPVATAYTGRVGLFRSDPPLLDLAYENIGHWQVRSNRRHALDLSCFPILALAGYTDADGAVKIGPNWAIRSDNTDATAQWIEPSGSSLDEVRQELQDIEGRMAALGLQMLVRETRAAETAEAKSIDKAEADSQLAASVLGLQDAIENALQFHAEYLRQDNGGSVVVNTDFRDQEMDYRMVETLSKAVERGHLSLRTMWERLVEGEVLSEDFDPDEEEARLDEEPIDALVPFVEDAARRREEEVEAEEE